MSPLFYYTWAAVYAFTSYTILDNAKSSMKNVAVQGSLFKALVGDPKIFIWQMVILLPFVEELCFRMFLKDLLSGWSWADHIIPITFGLFHATNYLFLEGITVVMAINNVVNTTFVGYYLQQFTVYQSIPRHMAFNAIGISLIAIWCYFQKTEPLDLVESRPSPFMPILKRRNSFDGRQNKEEMTWISEDKLNPELRESIKKYNEKRRRGKLHCDFSSCVRST
nr:hypothetical protein K-LCC10_0340 [Kaumoebavirus]